MSGGGRRIKTSNVISCIFCVLLSLPVARAQQICLAEFEGDPVFKVGVNFGTSALGDFNADGDLDLTVGLRLFLGDGDGGFPESVQLTGPILVAFDVKYTDFDGDGHRDLAMVQFGSDELVLFYGRDPEDHADGLFEPAVTVDFSRFARRVWHIEISDFNNDDRPDLVGISRGDLPVVLMNDGGRNYTVAGLPGGSSNHMLTTGDFDGDGNTDVATGSGADVIMIFGNGDGTFGRQLRGVLRHGFEPVGGHRFRSADFDGDGRSDLFATGGNWILIYPGSDIDPAGKFPAAAALTLDLSGGARFLEVVDMNVDGALDVVTLSATGPGSVYQVFFGQESDAGVSFVAGASHLTTLSGRGSVLAVGDMNGDDSPDIVLTTEDTGDGQVFLNISDCAGGTILAGDANADGDLNLSDATTILTHLFGGAALPCPAVVDVNGDGALNITDALHVLGFLFGGGPAPVDPGVTSCDAG